MFIIKQSLSILAALGDACKCNKTYLYFIEIYMQEIHIGQSSTFDLRSSRWLGSKNTCE